MVQEGSWLVVSCSPNEVNSEGDEETNSNFSVQDQADEGMPIITDIIEFLGCPWEE